MRTGINKKLIGSFIAGTIFAMAFIGWSLVTIERLISTMRQTETVTIRVSRIGDFGFLIQKLLKTSGDYLVTGDVTKRDEFDRLIGEMAEVINFLDKEKGSEEWKRISEEIRGEALRLGEMTLGVMYTDNPVGNREAALGMQEATLFGEGLIRNLDEFKRIASEGRDNLMVEARELAKSTRRILYVFPVAGVFLLFLLSLYLRRYILKPLIELYSGAEKLSRGDFSHRVNVKTGDELEDLSEGFNRMADSLKEREEKLKSLFKVIDGLNIELIDERRHKTAILRNINHELKTPLNHILGFAELLKELEGAGNVQDKVDRYAGIILKS
ncbi:MAG: HAMP domain-containing protein [Deltaproteobacteria bacterium]|nr:HAMP domain-containing protein [Deltaproteobacteria bacterium]